MVPDRWVYGAADRLIAQYGADALREVNRLICNALDHREEGRALLTLRIRLADPRLTNTAAWAAPLEPLFGPPDRHDRAARLVALATPHRSYTKGGARLFIVD